MVDTDGIGGESGRTDTQGATLNAYPREAPQESRIIIMIWEDRVIHTILPPLVKQLSGATINRTGPHRATPDSTEPHRARTRPNMTDYFTSTAVMSRIKAYSEPTVIGLQLNKQETLNTSVTNSSRGIVLFSVPRDGNQGLENAIFRPW